MYMTLLDQIIERHSKHKQLHKTLDKELFSQIPLIWQNLAADSFR